MLCISDGRGRRETLSVGNTCCCSKVEDDLANVATMLKNSSALSIVVVKFCEILAKLTNSMK
jgi:hypothetical protein